MKKTILNALILAAITYACNSSKEITAPIYDEQIADLLALENPDVTIDTTTLCFDGTRYNGQARIRHVVKSDRVFAAYIFGVGQFKDTLSKIAFDTTVKGTYHFSLGTGESGCGGKVVVWVVRKGVTYQDKEQGGCRSCSEPKTKFGIVCACGTNANNRYRAITQVTDTHDGSRVWLAYSSDTIHVTHYSPVTLGKEFDTLFVSHSPDPCGRGYLYIFKGDQPHNGDSLTEKQRIVYWSDLNCHDCINCGL